MAAHHTLFVCVGGVLWRGGWAVLAACCHTPTSQVLHAVLFVCIPTNAWVRRMFALV